jgi:hypothetical protein
MNYRRNFPFSRESASNYFNILPNAVMGGKRLFSCLHSYFFLQQELGLGAELPGSRSLQVFAKRSWGAKPSKTIASFPFSCKNFY